MASRRLVLFRHLPTTDDVADIYTAPSGAPELSKPNASKIRRIVGELNKFASKYHKCTYYASDNPRGWQTIAHLRAAGLSAEDVIYTKELNNIHQPGWSNLTQNAVAQTDLYRAWHNDPTSVTFPGGESLVDVQRRVDALIGNAVSPAVLFSHTTPMQVILCRVLGLDISRIWSFKFDHYGFTYIFKNVLVRLNSSTLSDFREESIRE